MTEIDWTKAPHCWMRAGNRPLAEYDSTLVILRAEGLNYAAIGRCMGWSTSTAYNRTRTACRRYGVHVDDATYNDVYDVYFINSK